MSFQVPQSGGNSQNKPQHTNQKKKTLRIIYTGIAVLLVGLLWLAFFQNNLTVDSGSFQYWAPYIPIVIGVGIFVAGLKRHNRGV